MSNALYYGLGFRTFNVIDDYNREALVIENRHLAAGRAAHPRLCAPARNP